MNDGEPRDHMGADAEKVMQELDEALRRINELEDIPGRLEDLKEEVEKIVKDIDNRTEHEKQHSNESMDYRIAQIEQKINNLINTSNILERLEKVEDTAEKALRVARQVWKDTRHLVQTN